MSRIRLRAAILITTILTIAIVNGCILSPDKPVIPPAPDTTSFWALTSKEAVIHNLQLAYNRADIMRYDELLHPQYTWYLQSIDVLPGQESYWTRQQDLNATTNMFESTRGGNPDPQWNIDRLTLELVPQSWSAFTDTINGAPCEDCWQTTRTYKINAVIAKGDTYIGNDLCLFIVVPVQEGSTKLYKLWRADDIPQ